MTRSSAGDRHPWKRNGALCGAAALWILVLGNPVETLERRFFDLTLRVRAGLGWTPAADPRIVILGADDADLAELPSLEEEYKAAARLITETGELGASAIVFDTIYVRGTAAMAEPILAVLGKGPRVVMAEAIRRHPGDTAETRRLRSFPFQPERQLPAGVINVAADRDGTYRGYSLLHWDGNTLEPSLAFAAWLWTLGVQWEDDVTQPGPGVIRWPEISADGTRLEQRELSHRTERGRLLDLRGRWQDGAGFGHLTLRRLHDLYAEHSAKGSRPLSGKIVFFANVATGVADTGATAFGANEPLVLLHATALNDLLQKSFFSRAPRWGDAIGIVIVFLLSAAIPFAPRKAGLAAFWLVGLLGIFGGCLLLLSEARVLAGTIALASLWTVAVVMEVARRHTREVAQRQRLRDTMGLYFSPRILNDVLANPGRLEPKRAEITVLLTDLRNSTDLAERLGPEGMLQLLNSIFAVENQAVFAEDGSMEKPVGDQFLAYWGAPDPQPDGADRALRATYALISGLQDLRKTFDPATRQLFGYGVALHAGRSLIGNIGSAQFYHYGPVGDLLNATARVEALTKFYGVLVLVTRDVYGRFTTAPEARVIDRVVVKGKTSTLELLELRNPTSPENFMEIANSYAEAFGAYQVGDFKAAGQMFERTSASDRPSAVMASRCEELQSNPPESWEGAYTFVTK